MSPNDEGHQSEAAAGGDDDEQNGRYPALAGAGFKSPTDAIASKPIALHRRNSAPNLAIISRLRMRRTNGSGLHFAALSTVRMQALVRASL